MNERLIKVNLLEEAEEFLDGLSPKARRKVLYNMSRVVKGEGIKNFSRSWATPIFGSFAHFMRKCTI